MDDDKYYTVQIKGIAYRFRPLPPEDVKRVVAISMMDPSGLRSFKVLCQALAESAGPEQWGALLDRYVARELDESELTAAVFGRLIKRQDKEGDFDELLGEHPADEG